MGNRIIAIICTIAAVAGVVLLGMGVKSYSDSQRETQAVYVELKEKLNELEMEKRDAEDAIRTLSSNVETTVDAVATTTLLFCGMSDRIYTEAFPIMEEYGIAGTIVMSGDLLPGVAGRLTDAHIVELVSAGWKLIPGWSDGDGENGIASVDEWIRAYGYTVEGAVFMPKAIHSPELEALLVAAGYNTMILDAGMGGSEAVTTEEVGDIWRPYAMGFQGNGPKTVLLEAVAAKGHLIFTVGFEDADELYDQNSLTNMLAYLQSYEEEGTMDNVDIAAARAYRTELDARRADANSGIAAQKAELQAKIDDIEMRIKALYEEYRD